jgi:hypothetical protein
VNGVTTLNCVKALLLTRIVVVAAHAAGDAGTREAVIDLATTGLAVAIVNTVVFHEINYTLVTGKCQGDLVKHR